MSDLISTPSQAQSTVSNEAFDALIDLLASDGIDENTSELPGRPATLRDPSGKLDFDKIRTMFAAQNDGHRVYTAPEPLGGEKNRVQFQTVPHEDGDSDDEPSTSPTVPSHPHSMSPKPVERPSHRRSSTFGNQHWVAIHENAAKVEDVAPTLQPLSFDELNTALAGAHEEVRSLRRQYDELQALVSKRSGTEIRDQVKPLNTNGVATDKGNGRGETRDAGSRARQGAVVPSSSDVPTEIAHLSENEAKRAFSALVRSLNLSPSAMASLSTPTASTSPQQNLSPPNPTRQQDVASIARALKFLGTVDELVWRRTSAPSGPRTLLPVSSEENIVALVARLELWERAVRRSSRV
jgi:hypothetical protein